MNVSLVVWELVAWSIIIPVHTWYSMQRASRESSCITRLSLTIQPVRGFENGSHHFPAAESALLAVDVPFSPHYNYFCVVAHIASLIAVTSGRRLHFLALQHAQAMRNNCISVVLLTYIHTYIHTYAESQGNMISCLASHSEIMD